MTTRPNFLFLFSDQHRADWLGCSSDLPLKTPHIDGLANKGTQFTHAITPSPICSPARACLATGLDFEHCGVATIHENLAIDKNTYYRSLRNSCYEVVGVGKFDLHKADMDWGLDGKMLLEEYGFTDGIDSEGKGDAIWAYRKEGRPKGPYLKYLEGRGLLEDYVGIYKPESESLLFEAINPLPDDAYCDTWIAQKGLDFLKSFSREKPWHLVVNFAGPHDPYDVTESMRQRWEGVNFPSPVANNSDDPEIIQLRQQNYAAMIENIDSQVGRYIELLVERGELENTIIVYSSDHGEMLGDHNRWQKSVWYQGSVGVPLVVSGPGVQCQVSNALISVHDIGASFLDYAGVDGLQEADAASFRNVLQGEAKHHRRVLKSALGDWRMVFDGRFKLVLREGEETLLYDLKEDPGEIEILSEKFPCKVRQLSDL